MRRLVGKIPALYWTYLLSATLLICGVLLSIAVPHAIRLNMGPPGGPILLTGVLFAATASSERYKLHISHHDNSYTMAMSGIPMIIGLLYLPVVDVTAVRVAGTAITMIWALRLPVRKIFFNLSAIVLENATTACLWHLIIGGHHQLDLPVGVVAVTASAMSDVITAYAVTFVIFINGGAVEKSDLREVMTNSVAVSTVTGIAAITDAVLLGDTLLGSALTVILVLATGLGYRSYVKIIERNVELSIVHRFVDESSGLLGRGEVAEKLLRNIRISLRAERIELTILHSVSAQRDEVRGVVGDSEAETFTLDDEGHLVATRHQMDLASNLRSRVYDQRRPILLPRDTDQEHLRAFLTDNGLRDAAIVPFGADGQFTGALLVANRFGDSVSFTEEDLQLLPTLTQYLAISISRAELFEMLSYDSTHDALTGLHNRAYLTERLGALADGDDEYAVFLLDLNGFKGVNDTFGHEVGDKLLITVAERLGQAVPADAVVARLGGDEFAVLLPRPAHGLATAVQAAHAITQALSEEVRFDDTLLAPLASVGVALSTAEASGSEMLRRADTAMYTAKSTEDHVAAYDPVMDRARLEQLQLVTDLRAALETDPDQLTLHYQPKLDLHTGAIVGVEALCRWQHPTLGAIRPDRFIVLAETSGLIGPLTDRVLGIALADCRTWRDAGHHISVAVNLSAHNIGSPTLPEVVRVALDRAGVGPESLIIEITESSIIGDPEQAVPILDQLARMGVEVSLDDFGTGYSSLSYLQRLPVAEVKIDRSFVQGLDDAATRDNARVIVSSITGLGTNLGLRVVAEGVENGQRMAELRDMGCHVAQGYHIARPMPMAALQTWLSSYPAARPITRLAAGR
jgi:diguanylate cyclase (GGDEF)-like protein